LPIVLGALQGLAGLPLTAVTPSSALGRLHREIAHVRAVLNERCTRARMHTAARAHACTQPHARAVLPHCSAFATEQKP
jgi:hypothetical protein